MSAFSELSFTPILILIIWSYVMYRIGVGVGRRHVSRAAKRTVDLATVPVETRQRIDALVRSGERIEAIKLLREATGCSLAEAKWTIDAIPGSSTKG